MVKVKKYGYKGLAKSYPNAVSFQIIVTKTIVKESI